MEEDRIILKGVSHDGKVYTQKNIDELDEALSTSQVERLKELGIISGEGWSGGDDPPAPPPSMRDVASRGYYLLCCLREDDLRGLVDHLEKRVAEYTEEEVEVTVTGKSNLPIGFPARHLLVQAGFDTAEKIRAAPDADLESIKGVGASTVTQIREALG